jgi:hypothetical protein
MLSITHTTLTSHTHTYTQSCMTKRIIILLHKEEREGREGLEEGEGEGYSPQGQSDLRAVCTRTPTHYTTTDERPEPSSPQLVANRAGREQRNALIGHGVAGARGTHGYISTNTHSVLCCACLPVPGCLASGRTRGQEDGGPDRKSRRELSRQLGARRAAAHEHAVLRSFTQWHREWRGWR